MVLYLNFVTALKTNTNIALLLSFIFLAKLIAIEANALNIILGENVIALVKPNCKKKNTLRPTKDSTYISAGVLLADKVLEINEFCNSQFSLELFTWSTNNTKPFRVINEHFSSRLDYRYLDIAFPPPRLV
ncbi:hypothetical protein SAMN05421797_10866 [Maribacter ulvicola]|uniref:Uncharacterized protein n=1 Tax=Maribacter ulvicola TaxID=228959 RepID=A0A1N6Z7H8_9FLAO|nr:hypothetical protein SAMN05421797_10866 [Maribacter ulvicola]